MVDSGSTFAGGGVIGFRSIFYFAARINSLYYCPMLLLLLPMQKNRIISRCNAEIKTSSDKNGAAQHQLCSSVSRASKGTSETIMRDRIQFRYQISQTSRPCPCSKWLRRTAPVTVTCQTLPLRRSFIPELQTSRKHIAKQQQVQYLIICVSSTRWLPET